MTKRLIPLLIPVILFSCSESKPSNDLIEQGEMMNSAEKDTCLCNELIDSLSISYKDGEPFTGVCTHNYPNTDLKYMVKGYMDGKLHGKLIYYDKEEKIILEEIYESGNKKRNGTSSPISCNCSELLIKPIPGETINRAFLDEIPFTGTCTESYPNSDQKYMDMTYKSGVLEGFTTYYDKMGEPMFMEKYERGELIKVFHDKN